MGKSLSLGLGVLLTALMLAPAATAEVVVVCDPATPGTENSAACGVVNTKHGQCNPTLPTFNAVGCGTLVPPPTLAGGFSAIVHAPRMAVAGDDYAFTLEVDLSPLDVGTQVTILPTLPQGGDAPCWATGNVQSSSSAMPFFPNTWILTQVYPPQPVPLGIAGPRLTLSWGIHMDAAASGQCKVSVEVVNKLAGSTSGVLSYITYNVPYFSTQFLDLGTMSAVGSTLGDGAKTVSPPPLVDVDVNFPGSSSLFLIKAGISASTISTGDWGQFDISPPASAQDLTGFLPQLQCGVCSAGYEQRLPFQSSLTMYAVGIIHENEIKIFCLHGAYIDNSYGSADADGPLDQCVRAHGRQVVPPPGQPINGVPPVVVLITPHQDCSFQQLEYMTQPILLGPNRPCNPNPTGIQVW